MPLPAIHLQLQAELNILDQHFRDFAAGKPTINSAAGFTYLDDCLLEGLLSKTWQAWCGFCRSYVMESCMGTVDGRGNTIPALPLALSEHHVSGACIRAKNGTFPDYWTRVNPALFAEPTWGDANVLTNIVSRLQPANSIKTLAVISSISSKATALQTIRNGAAHNHHQNLANINQLRTSYTSFQILHPVQALFWLEPTSNDFLITDALTELGNAAAAATA